MFDDGSDQQPQRVKAEDLIPTIQLLKKIQWICQTCKLLKYNFVSIIFEKDISRCLSVAITLFHNLSDQLSILKAVEFLADRVDLKDV